MIYVHEIGFGAGALRLDGFVWLHQHIGPRDFDRVLSFTIDALHISWKNQPKSPKSSKGNK